LFSSQNGLNKQVFKLQVFLLPNEARKHIFLLQRVKIYVILLWFNPGFQLNWPKRTKKSNLKPVNILNPPWFGPSLAPFLGYVGKITNG